MTTINEDTGQLVQQAADGDESASERLLHRHRERLARMVAMRMDPRVRARFDPSDVIQEALLVAQARLCQYLRDQPMPFYPWLRKITWEQLLKMQERHLDVQKRSVKRETNRLEQLRDESVSQLVHRLAGSVSAPSGRLIREETRRRIGEALNRLADRDREILELLYLEQLDSIQASEVLDVSPSAVRKRHFRAIRRLSSLLDDQFSGSGNAVSMDARNRHGEPAGGESEVQWNMGASHR